MASPQDSVTDSTAGIDTETTTAAEQPGFGDTDLDSETTARGLGWWFLPVLTATVLLALAASGVYSIYNDSSAIPVAGHERNALNVMYGLAVSFVGILVAGRVWSSLAGTKRLLGRLRNRPVVLVCSVYAFLLFVAGSVAPFLTSEPKKNLLIPVQPPAWSSVSNVYPVSCQGTVVDGSCQGTLSHVFGTNIFGQDLLAVTLFGLNTTLRVAVTASVLAATLGVLVGVTAGYFGGRVDEILMRYVDVQRALPVFFVYILLSLAFGYSYPLMILVFGLFSWGGIARLVRSEVKQLRVTPYVRVARQSGADSTGIIRRHVLPGVMGTLLTAVAVLFAKFVVYEAALAFLALTDSTVPSLGNEIAKAVGQEAADPFNATGPAPYDWWKIPWTVYVPVGALCSLLLAVSFLGDEVQEIVDPTK